MAASVDGNNAKAQDLPSLRDLAKQEADEGREDVRHFFRTQADLSVPPPEALEALINELLVPAWKAIGRHDVLNVIIEQNWRARIEIEQCLQDARHEVADRSRAAMMLRDEWKADGLPEDPKTMLAKIESHLAAFYIATGALEILEAMLGTDVPKN